jgi:cysteine-rich repeat protein
MRGRASIALIAWVFIAASCAEEASDPDDPSPAAGAGADGGGGTTAPTSSAANGGGDEGGAGGDGGGTVQLCGNGDLDPGEQCDDRNTSDNDGCSSRCQFEPTGPDDICPGEEIDLSPVVDDLQTGSVEGTNTTTLPQYNGSCGGSANDTVYVVTPDVDGQLTATLTSDFDAVLYARDECGEPDNELGCADVEIGGGAEVLIVPAEGGQPVYLFVDGYGGETGDYTLDIEIATATCGNAIAEFPETCDDGDLVAGDGCAPDCTIEPGGTPGACPGHTFILSDASPTAVRHISFLGDTTGLTTSIIPVSCSGSGPQGVYSIVPDVDGHMTVTYVASFDNATLHVRSECDVSSAQLDCTEGLEPFQVLQVTVPVFANNAIAIFADSTASNYAGLYALDVDVTPADCGNDEVDGGEECDDGNSLADDGCAPDCSLETPPTNNDVCQGAVLPIDGITNTGVITASTAALAANYAGTTCLTLTTSLDAVYQVNPPITGLLTLTLDPQFDGGLYVRNDCPTAGAANQLGCVDAIDGNGNEVLSVPAVADTPLWIFVDSSISGTSAAGKGVFELSASFTPGECGNAVLEGGEGCDDGNVLSGDGCDDGCALEPAGAEDTCPGEVLALTQQGNDWLGSVYSGNGNLTADTTATGCTSSGRDAFFAVTAPISGVLTANLTQAAFNATLHARTDCATVGTQITCANDNSAAGPETLTFAVSQGVTYYVIVDSTSTALNGPFNLNVKVTPPGCGDTIVTLPEECDDGNTAPGDGCAGDCTLEMLAGVDTCPGYAVNLTGSGSDPRVAVITTDTTPLNANYSGSCGGSSREAVFAVTSDVSGNLNARLVPASGYDVVFYGRTDCLSTGTQFACDDNVTGGYINEVAVLAGTPVYLFMDGLAGEFGAATLTITVTP